MSWIPDEILPHEEQQRRSPLAPVEPPASVRPIWDWEELNAKFRPRLIAAGVIRFGLTQDECEDAAQTVFLKVLAMNPRVRDPKAYLRAAFLNRCDYIIEARDRGHKIAFTDRVAETARTTEKSGSPSRTLWKRVQDCLTKRTRS
jgi:DNA-directed RNA polymerase specialized sigma24 family protein